VALLDSEKMREVVDTYSDSPMIHSLFEVFYKQCVKYCSVPNCCANCGYRRKRYCGKWGCNTKQSDYCDEWRMWDAEL
jgi:hypothetical protein